MDFNATIDLIIKELKEAGDIIDDLKKYPGMPVLQIELAKLKCRNAAEVIAILKNSGGNTWLNEKEQIPVEKAEKAEFDSEVKQKPEKVFAPPVIKEKEIKPDPAEIEYTGVSQVVEPKKSEKKEQESSILADQFSHLSGSFNEQLGTNMSDEDIEDILKTKPLTTLEEAIGINDKFLFIREIFNGNQNDYLMAISRLENAENITDAKAVIMSYTGENIENKVVKQLINLVKRKLQSNE